MEYKSILVLVEKLEQANIPYEMEERFNGYHVGYPVLREKDCVCSVIEHDFSYGRLDDLLEIMGLLTLEEKKADVDNEYAVAGYLTVDDVFSRIKKHYRENK